MRITKEIALDLQRRSVTAPIAAVQYDSSSRAVAITLMDAGSAWSPPGGASVAVSYRKPDGTTGLYDKLPDGTVATSVSGNVVTAIFAPQMLTVAGCVEASVVFYSGTQQLATFPFEVQVARNPGAAGEVSNDYYTYPTIAALGKAVGDIEDLKTETKESIVAAINELFDSLGSSGGSSAVSPTATVEQTDTGAKITITDASGTTTAEITNGEKGDKGDPGEKGDPGKDGEDGYTPVKGTDYCTDADKEELVAAVLAALPTYEGETAYSVTSVQVDGEKVQTVRFNGEEATTILAKS